jgi:ABC-type sugar transport system ATPase subunit
VPCGHVRDGKRCGKNNSRRIDNHKNWKSVSSFSMNFDLHHGEILGIAGLIGSRHTKALQGLYGVRPAEYSTLEIDGAGIPWQSAVV